MNKLQSRQGVCGSTLSETVGLLIALNLNRYHFNSEVEQVDMALSRFTAASVLTCLVCFTTAYPTGAPNAACNNFRPNHVNGQTGQRFAPQNGEQQTQQTGSDDDCPYTVKFSGKYLPGQPITRELHP